MSKVLSKELAKAAQKPGEERKVKQELEKMQMEKQMAGEEGFQKDKNGPSLTKNGSN